MAYIYAQLYSMCSSFKFYGVAHSYSSRPFLWTLVPTNESTNVLLLTTAGQRIVNMREPLKERIYSFQFILFCNDVYTSACLAFSVPIATMFVPSGFDCGTVHFMN